MSLSRLAESARTAHDLSPSGFPENRSDSSLPRARYDSPLYGASPCRFVIPRNVESVDPAHQSAGRARERAQGRKVTRPGDRPDQIRPGRTGRSRSHEIGEFNNLLRDARERRKRRRAGERERVGRGVAIISGRYRSLIRHAARGNARLDLS